MYNFLALLSGFIIAVVVTLNGQLTDVYANYNATFIIHLVAVVFSFIFLKLGKKKIFPSEKLPFWFYLGGAVGIFNALFQNAAFGKISLTSILALALFGQTVLSIFIDNFGWFGMERRPFKKSSLLGFGFSIIGVVVMLDLSGGINPSAILAIFFAFASGITTVVSRSINGRLAEYSGSMAGSFINHLVGLPLTLILALVMPGNQISLLFQQPSGDWWIYLGGLAGVLLIFVTNMAVMKITALRLSLLSFVGQVLLSVLLDLLLDSSFSRVTLYGGLIVAAGVGLNMLIDYLQEIRYKKTQAER